MFPRETEIITPEVWRKACGDGQAPRLVGVDFETFYSSSYSVRQLGNWAYCQDPRFKAYLVAVSEGEQACVCPPAEFPWETITGADWVSHNRDFDRAVFRRLVELRDVVAWRFAGVRYADIALAQGVTQACAEKRHRRAMELWPELRSLFPRKVAKQGMRKPARRRKRQQ